MSHLYRKTDRNDRPEDLTLTLICIPCLPSLPAYRAHTVRVIACLPIVRLHCGVRCVTVYTV